MNIEEIKEVNVTKFIAQQVNEIQSLVGNGLAINALSGGIDSSVVTLLGHKAIGNQLKTYFIDNGLMRHDESQQIVSWFKKLEISVEIVNAQNQFFDALKGITDPEEKREAITQTFYKDVFSGLAKEGGARFLFQGTNYTDIEETVAGIKRQHNILYQLGIDTEAAYGYKVIEPLIQLRKPLIRKIGKALGLPKEIFNRPPFPGPALSARVIGEVSPERVEIARKATQIVENELNKTDAFQHLAILHNDQVTGIKDGRREFGLQIEIRCWQSEDAKTASPTPLGFKRLEKLAQQITTEIPAVVSVTYNITKKPPSTIEAI